MPDLLRIYVLFDAQSSKAEAYAEAVSQHFDGLGMERDGVQYRVPVRFRSEPWQPTPGAASPREIALHEAEHNAIVLLHDDYTAADQAAWDPYVASLRTGIAARGRADQLIPFQLASSAAPLPCIARVHHARQDRWTAQLPEGG